MYDYDEPESEIDLTPEVESDLIARNRACLLNPPEHFIVRENTRGIRLRWATMERIEKIKLISKIKRCGSLFLFKANPRRAFKSCFDLLSQLRCEVRV